ncbi:MAG TPA: beta-N-acetylhexosaminidase [Clostridiaceae bacterium]|nr:beta-N-acetylhexosaminidase [Clostridiaceae bacterium]
MIKCLTTIAVLVLAILVLSATLTLTGCTGKIRTKSPENIAEKTETPYKEKQQKNGKQKPQNETRRPQNGNQKPEETANPVKELISNMTLEEKVGQLVIVGLEGYAMDENARSMIEDYHVGGFILFGRNVENANQLLDLINSLKVTNSKKKVPIFISVDQEGGRVNRMPEELIKLPSGRVVGEVNDEDLSYEIGGVIAEQLRSFGFNMNFAPVLDIDSNPKNPVIGDRSYGSSAEIVSKLGMESMKGIRKGGIIPVVKHFPGHGDTFVDSHIGLPTVDSDIDRLNDFELVPFIEAINNRADAVMVAHILINKIDPEYPASLSKIIIKDILRRELNFNGVVITDDITMGAITENYDIGDAAVRAVNAGSDIVLVCHGHDNRIAVLDALTKAVQNGTIPEKRLDESVYRILKLKHKYRMTDNTVDSVDIDKINDKISDILNKISLPSEE